MNIVIITGASSGMGLEFALQLDSLYKNVDEFWLISRRKEQLLEVASNMEHTTRILDMDVTLPKDLSRFRSLLKKEQPVIRMLVNSAGYGIFGEFEALGLREQTGMIDVNCKALTRMTYMCIPYMKKNSRIIQMASSAAFMPQPQFAIYAATKSFVHSFSLALGEELRHKQIYVTSVCPGPVNTPFFDIAYKDNTVMLLKKITMANPEKVVAQAIRDSYHKKSISIYGPLINGFKALTKMVPSKVLLASLRLLR